MSHIRSQVTRLNIFETNSSSTHSICIADGPLCTQFLPDLVYTGDFGWEVEDYYDYEIKASYLLTYAGIYGSKDDVEILKKIIEEHTGGPVEFSIDKEHYIDHQSLEVAGNLFAHPDREELIAKYLFCKDSYLHTDNDNH